MKLLVANRGEIAVRVIRTARELGIPTVAVYSTADAQTPAVEMADEAVCIGPPPARESYLDIRNVIGAAEVTGCEQVGLIGFCMGGMYALKSSAVGRFDRVAGFYGMIRVPEAWSGPGQGQPLDAVAARGDTEVMEIVGTIDQWTPPEDVDALEALGATVVRYEGADHGFVHDPDRPVHRPEDAADAWSRVLAFLAG